MQSRDRPLFLGDNYNEFSIEVSRNIEKFLQGEQTAETTVNKIEQVAKQWTQ